MGKIAAQQHFGRWPMENFQNETMPRLKKGWAPLVYENKTLNTVDLLYKGSNLTFWNLFKLSLYLKFFYVDVSLLFGSHLKQKKRTIAYYAGFSWYGWKMATFILFLIISEHKNIDNRFILRHYHFESYIYLWFLGKRRESANEVNSLNYIIVIIFLWSFVGEPNSTYKKLQIWNR